MDCVTTNDEKATKVVEKQTSLLDNGGHDDDGDGLTFEQYTAGGMGRHLGVVSTTLLTIGRIIGTGIFSTPSSVVASVGSVGAALALWVVGLLLSICGLCVYLEFACMIPRSGGDKNYLEAVYRRPKMLTTTVYAVQYIALGLQAASDCNIFASNIFLAAGHVASEWEKRGIAIGVMVLVTAMHVFLPRVGVQGMNFFSVLKVSILIFIVVTGWVVLGGGVKSIEDPRASFQNAFANSAQSAGPYAVALFKTLSSYGGWSGAMYILNEVRNPIQTVKIAGSLGLSVCGVLYLFANIAFFAAGTPQDIIESGTTVAPYFMGKVFGAAARRALAAFVALSALGGVVTVTFTQGRVNQELAKEGVIPFPRFWASSWPLGSPSSGLLLHLILSVLVIGAIPTGAAYYFMLDLQSYPGSVLGFFVGVGLFYLRYSEPDRRRPFRAWWSVAVLFVLGQAFGLVAPFLRPPGGRGDTPPLPYWLYCVVGIAILLVSVAYWFVWWIAAPRVGKYKLVPRNETLSDGTNLVVYHRVRRRVGNPT